MKTAITALVAVVALATSSIACSSPSSGNQDDVDTGSALSALKSPTGSFSEQTAGKAFGGYRGARQDSSKISTPGASSGAGGVKTGSSTIKLLDAATSSAACGQGQSCACPSGGSMSYRAESSADGDLVKVSFTACGFEDGYAFDGKAILLASKKSLLGLSSEKAAPPIPKKPSSPASPDDGFGGDTGSGSDTGLQEAEEPQTGGSGQYVALLLAAKGTVSNGSQKLALEFALLTEAHYAFLAVSVPDGKIVIGVSDDGRAIVKSKEGTWNCNTSSGGWSCTSDTGKKMDVKEEAASASSEPSAPKPSDPSETDPTPPSDG